MAFPEVDKETCFPHGLKVVFCTPKFQAESNDRIILIPSLKLMKSDAPEPNLDASDMLQRPVMYVPIQKYCCLLRGLRECEQHGFSA